MWNFCKCFLTRLKSDLIYFDVKSRKVQLNEIRTRHVTVVLMDQGIKGFTTSLSVVVGPAAHLDDVVVVVQADSSNHHSRQHEGQTQTHAPAPGPGLVTHRQGGLGILHTDTEEIHSERNHQRKKQELLCPTLVGSFISYAMSICYYGFLTACEPVFVCLFLLGSLFNTWVIYLYHCLQM